MGLLSGLVTWPLAPIRGVVWIAERVEEVAERELSDPDVIRQRLEEVEIARDAGEITDEEAAEQEAELVRRLMASRSPDGGMEV
ncbi:c-type cytochrome biogenesis protein CcmI [Streptomyces sp. NBC_00879]|uniref:c-type cytochrome biogenesis protein CcmI n=1 Tax=unclassified Streptomyces TaxID=2593676 RepID=UPI00324F7C7D|nr:c-type cytochrome biogenesis protein CcmI [Streptomyces sp. NBC_00885]WSY72807.1 c-type cytochrome biogenesis protein CcmI [Streptomyces sp. NBC_00879]